MTDSAQYIGIIEQNSCDKFLSYYEIKAELFDKSFNTWGGEDVDLGISLHMNNNFFMMLPDASSTHWPHKKQIENRSDKSKCAAIRIHEKYVLWMTSFYGADVSGENYSLNKIISLLQHDGHKLK